MFTTEDTSYDWRLSQLDNPTRVDFLVQSPSNMGVWIALNAHPYETDGMYEIGKLLFFYGGINIK